MDKRVLKRKLDSVLEVVAVASLVILFFTIPSLLIWNLIIAPKFQICTFTFWEMFWMLIFIKLTLPTHKTNGKS